MFCSLVSCCAFCSVLFSFLFVSLGYFSISFVTWLCWGQQTSQQGVRLSSNGCKEYSHLFSIGNTISFKVEGHASQIIRHFFFLRLKLCQIFNNCHYSLPCRQFVISVAENEGSGSIKTILNH